MTNEFSQISEKSLNIYRNTFYCSAGIRYCICWCYTTYTGIAKFFIKNIQRFGNREHNNQFHPPFSVQLTSQHGCQFTLVNQQWSRRDSFLCHNPISYLCHSSSLPLVLYAREHGTKAHFVSNYTLKLKPINPGITKPILVTQ